MAMGWIKDGKDAEALWKEKGSSMSDKESTGKEWAYEDKCMISRGFVEKKPAKWSSLWCILEIHTGAQILRAESQQVVSSFIPIT